MKKIFKNKCLIILTAGVAFLLTSLTFTSCKQYKISYIRGLKKNAEYLGTLPNPDIDFEYSLPTDSNLVFLRTKYSLDSVAGIGTETEQMINLMLWVHRLAPHASNPSYPKIRNALNLVDLCLNEGKSINCYMYAIILNEVYLSMGFYSRLIHLRYKHSGESHWVNAVYSAILKKWIMMDANHGAYFMDEEGTILSLPEIRRKMINKEKLVFNEELEYVGDNKGVKIIKGIFGIEKFYRWYISKNILKYSTNLINTFNIESDNAAEIIQLTPTNYLKEIDPLPKKRKYERYNFYRTDDEDFFWQSPVKN